MIRVLLISTDAELRRQWRLVLRELTADSRVDECLHLEGALASLPVEYCLVDLGGRRSNDLQAVVEIIKNYSNVSFIALSAVPDPYEGLTLLKSGAKGYCNRQISPGALAAVVGVVQDGGIWAGQQVTQHLLAQTISVADPLSQPLPSFELLTERERQVSESVAAGLSNKAIAANAGITERTVKAHLNAVFRKTGIRNRVQLALAVSDLLNRLDRVAQA